MWLRSTYKAGLACRALVGLEAACDEIGREVLDQLDRRRRLEPKGLGLEGGLVPLGRRLEVHLRRRLEGLAGKGKVRGGLGARV